MGEEGISRIKKENKRENDQKEEYESDLDFCEDLAIKLQRSLYSVPFF